MARIGVMFLCMHGVAMRGCAAYQLPEVKLESEFSSGNTIRCHQELVSRSQMGEAEFLSIIRDAKVPVLESLKDRVQFESNKS